MKPGRPFDSRGYRGQLERELVVGTIVIGVIVGGGLIALIWGIPAFFTAMACLALILVVTALIWLFLKGIEIITREP